MRRNQKKIKKKQKTITDPRRDKRAERIIYAVLLLLIIIGIALGYRMSQEFGG